MSERFALPELPPVCLSCGARSPLAPARIVLRYTSKASALVTALALCFGFLFFRQKVYTLQLPLCGACSGYIKRAKAMTVAGWLLFLPVLLLFLKLSLDYEREGLLLGALVYVVAAYFFCAATRKRGTPKKVRVDYDHLVIHVPGHGDFDLLDDTRRPERRYYASTYDSPQHQAPQQRAHAGPGLNRSVCEGCGFINFTSAAECKKCRAPLGRTAAA